MHFDHVNPSLDSQNGKLALERRLRVTRGQEPGDLLLTGGQVVNVFTERVEPANVIIADGWIAGVGPFEWRAEHTIAAAGKTIVPGFIDCHAHLESTLLTPAELSRLIVPHGTTALISDSHEIGNVLGVAGIDMLLTASAGLPLELFFMASSCVPATRWEHAGAVIGPAEVAELLRRPRVLGLAEVMDIPAVLAGEPDMLAKIRETLSLGRVVDGHAPGLSGHDLQAYVAAGIRSDHESVTPAEARAKAALGMLVQVREGSVARNLDALLRVLAAGELGDFWCLVTDDIFPDRLRAHGHLDGLLRRVVAAGVPPAAAVRHVTLIPARHYGLMDRGAVAPGYRADVALLEDVRNFRPELVIKDGRIVAQGGKYLADGPAPELSHPNTVHVAPLDESAFHLCLASETCPVIRIVPDQIVTSLEMQTVSRRDGAWAFDPQRDVALIASIERHRAGGAVGLGLVSGFGLSRDGALGSSVAHDSHNLIVAGTNARDMLACVRALQHSGGGFVVVSGGEVRASLPLPIAGLLSTQSADTVCRQLQEGRDAARALGCRLAEPFGTLSFLALPVIPELRITDRGMFDVQKQEFVRLLP
jgi:adenine deaminase